MKKKYLSVALVLTLSFSMLNTSCIGSFALFNKLLAWNKTINNKFVNELVFFAFWVVPVYEVAALADGKGYTITSENDGSVVRLDFDQSDNSWSVSANGGESYKFMTFIDDTHVNMITPDGSMREIEVSENGLMAYQSIVANASLLANR